MNDDVATDTARRARDARITFPCGAIYEADFETWQPSVKRGRIRLLIVDSQNATHPVPPKLNGKVVGVACLWGCKGPRRKKQRAMSDGPDPFAFRVVVSCSGVLAKGAST